jgi:hypothetical protein
MWRPNEPVEDDVAEAPGIHLQNKRRRSRRRAWRDGPADQTVVQGLEDVRSYRAFERALIGSVDPRSASAVLILDQRSSLRSLIGWQASCGDFVGPARSKLACFRCRVHFCSHASRTRPAHLVNRASRMPMGIAKPRPRTDETTRGPATKNTVIHAPAARTMVELPHPRPIFPAPFQP